MRRKLDSAKTVSALRGALIDLLEEKPYTDISIREITDRAGRSRTTFYLFYSSKDELACDICDVFLEDCTKHLIAFLQTGNQDSRELLIQAFEMLKARRRVVLGLWGIKTLEDSPYLRMQSALYTSMLQSLRAGNRKMKFDGELEYYSELFAASAMASVKWWLGHCDSYSAEYMAFCVSTCIQNGAIKLLE